MIKTLQKKFVITAMTAITVLILLLLGAINTVNLIWTDNQTDRTLSVISGLEGMNRTPEMPSPMPHTFFKPRNERDTFMASTFFTVRFDENNNVIKADVSHIASVNEESAVSMATDAITKNEESGKTGTFKYKVFYIKGLRERKVVFLDISEQLMSLLRILFLSAGIGLICWLFMLILVMLLSKKAIRPIAINMEKQRQFVTDAGHEIKTPLAIIMSNAEAMELYNGENKWSRNIKEQTARLNGLMQNLLLLSRTDEGAALRNVSEFSLSSVVRDTLGSFDEPFKQKNLSVTAHIYDDIMISADRNSIIQLVVIFFDNALKYTNESGKIDITLQKKDSCAIFQIKNTCSSLPDVSPDKLFDRFYRGDSARTQKSGGYGIGLSVAKAIAESNKASVSASYEGDDTVIFKFKI